MNVESLRLDSPPATKRAPYLSGPIPWSWVKAASGLPGKALAVGLVLWHYRSLRKSMEVKVGLADIAQKIDTTESAVRRGCRALEGKGLVEVQRSPGCKMVFILPSSK